MPVNAEDLSAAWSEARDGAAPDPVTAMHLRAMAAQVAAGALSDEEALAHATGAEPE